MVSVLIEQRRAAGAWLLGGLPLLTSSLQAISALRGDTTLYWIPVIGRLAESLTSYAVVYEAAGIFYDQTTVVQALFLLIAVAWIAQGILMFSQAGRAKTYSKTGSAGAVVMSGILYGFLFLGIYSGLLSAPVPMTQLAVFFLVPVVATGSLGVAYWSYSWRDQRRAEAISRIKLAEAEAKDQRLSLERALKDLPLEIVEDLSPRSVRKATDVKKDFFDDCDGIVEESGSVLDRSSRMDVAELENTSHSLEQQAASLDSRGVETVVESELRSTMDDVVSERFDNVQSVFTSSYGERFQTANLSTDLRSVSLPNSDEQILISTASQGGVADQLQNVIAHNEISLEETIDLLEKVDAKIHNELVPHLNEYEQNFREIEGSVKTNLESAAEKIEDIGGHTGTTLERTFIRGTKSEGTAAADDIRIQLRDGRRKLHACELDGAIEAAKRAEAMSEEYMEAIRFIRSALIPGIERGKDTVSSVPHPDSREHGFFTEDLIDRLKEPLKNDYSAAIEVDFDRRKITIEHDVESAGSEKSVREQPVTAGLRDEVKYLIREIQTQSGDGDVPSETTIGINSLPTSVKEADPIPEFVEFVESVDNLEITDYPQGIGGDNSQRPDRAQGPGYVSVKATDGTPIERVTEDLIDEYRVWAKRTEESVNL